MKNLFLLALMIFSNSAFSLESLKGKFELDNVRYEISFRYDIPFNQVVSTQGIRIIDDLRLPEQAEPMPAFCMLDMEFPANVAVTIKNLFTGQIVYTRHSLDYVSASAYGGLAEAGRCDWVFPRWSEKVTTLFRITEHAFSLNGKSYRYFMDTNLVIDAYGTLDELVYSRSTTPAKGSDGKRDGEIWIDTQPTPDGNYHRVWAPLSL